MSKKPVYLLAGGRGNNDPSPIFRAVMRDIGKDKPVIAYVGAANGDNPDFMGRMGGMITQVGRSNLVHAPFTGRINKAKSIEILKTADAIFVSGGDVEAGMKVLEDKGVTGVFAELYSEGKLFFGISAGSIMLAKEWVRWTNPDDDSTAELFKCLGVAPVICDTHGEGDEWEELRAALMLKKAGAIGYGITSETCLKCYPTGEMEALGGGIARFVRRKDGIELEADLVPL